MRQCAVVLAALGFGASLVGCGGSASREAAALRLATGAGQIRGTDVWNSVESIFPRNRVTYRENVVVNPIKKQLAITLQDTPAPYRVGMPGPDETSPLTFENAARQLAAALGDSRKLIEGDLDIMCFPPVEVHEQRTVGGEAAQGSLDARHEEIEIIGEPI